jgi:cellulose synthase (UDP-forming)
MSDWYFSKFEDRRPPEPIPHSPTREFLFQASAICAIVLGGNYLYWRWTDSLNWSAWWFSIPLVLAETLALFGSVLFFLSIWRTQDTAQKAPPATLSDVDPLTPSDQDRPLSVDVFFPTYNEDIELVRLSVQDAKKMRYPHPIDLKIYVLDDGRRPAMAAVAKEEGVGYITRTNNQGYKAGNLRNGLEQSSGDLMVICDADTRPLPNLLEETLGYFREPQVAWVQTPQWFYDLDEGTSLPEWMAKRLKLGGVGRFVGKTVEKVIGPVHLGKDLLANDPAFFYDVIQRRRNWCNASFCCGAGSIHRREAVMEAALKGYTEQVQNAVTPYTKDVADPELRQDLHSALASEAAREVELTPYKFHVSEDIYTSIILHSDKERQWRSVFHPKAVSKMLSPQDLLTWTIQRFKYAGGTLDIFKNDNPLRRPGLSAWQKVMYGTTIYSYLSPIWTMLFLLAPILYLFTGVSPLSTYGDVFYAHFVPFFLLNRLALLIGTWGVSSWRGEQYYISFFWLNLKALWDVANGRPIKFHVTPKTKQSGNFYRLVIPQLILVGLTLAGLLLMGVRVFAFGSGEVGTYLVNFFWSLNNILCLSVIISAAGKKSAEA